MKSWTILLSTLCLFSCNQQENKFEKYVDPLIGTDIRIVQGKDKNSTEERGQIMPAVGVPHGMTNWVAQTQDNNNDQDNPGQGVSTGYDMGGRHDEKV